MDDNKIIKVNLERDYLMLNKIMEMDHVILINSDGTVTPHTDKYGPEVTVEVDADGQYIGTRDDHGRLTWNVDVSGDHWELMSGWALDGGGRDVIMHPSQYIGGDLAREIMATPGYWVAVMVQPDNGEEAEGWAVAWREPQCARCEAGLIRDAVAGCWRDAVNESAECFEDTGYDHVITLP